MLCTEKASEEFAQMKKMNMIQLLRSKLCLQKGPKKLFTLRTVTKTAHSVINVPEESRMQFLMSFFGNGISAQPLLLDGFEPKSNDMIL